MQTTRRNFLASTSAALALGGTLFNTSGSTLKAATEKAQPFRTKLYKALIGASPTDEICETWKKAGFEGMEVTNWNVSPTEAQKARLIAEKHDFYLHSVMRGWAEFNNKDESLAKKSIEETKTAIRAAAAYGAETILLVPCRVGGMKMPEAWNFDIGFDPLTLVVKSVTSGDNSEFAEYIAAQNASTEATLRAVEELIPVAAKEGVIIAIENVWNNLWSTPEYAAALIRHFDNPWVKAYFDLGNHTKYSKAEYWIEAFGSLMVKLHIKGFNITKPLGKRGGGEGDWCNIDKANIDWKSIRVALENVGYNGWISIEEKGYTDEQFSKVLDDFIAGTL